MVTVPDKILTWQMVQSASHDKETGAITPGKIEKTEIPVPELKSGEVLVEIAGCGVCHTDLGYFYDGVPTDSRPPLTLGHEISGRVIAGDSGWMGKEVIIPAVMPCNNCPICAAGRGNRCLAQKMPGNSMGIYGGFSSHIVVPSQDLCPVEARGHIPLEHLAVVADAVASPYQAAMRANLVPGDLIIVIGTGGGLGSYMTQICSALGAKEVIGIDVVPKKLERALKYGATHTINSMDKSAREVKDEFRSYCKEKGLPYKYGWKIFEWTGTKAGQDIGLELLTFVSTLVIGGFGPQKVEYCISRLMAFNAEIIGTWACLPEYYPAVLDMVLSRKIQVEPFVEIRPMSSIVKTFEKIHKAGPPDKRIVLVPDF